MNRKLLLGAVTVTLVSLTGLIAEPRKSTPLQDFMRQKLEHSKGVLEGLATENFDLIAKNAEKLRAMSQGPGWKSYDNPGYAWRINLFRRNVDALVKSATDRNLDGATLAYVNLTMSCVECHKFARGKESAFLDKPWFGPKSSLYAAIGN